MFTPTVVKYDDEGKPLITYYGTPDEFKEYMASVAPARPRPAPMQVVDAGTAKQHNNLLVIEKCPFRSKRVSEGDKIVHLFVNEDGSTEKAGDCGCGLNRCRLLKGKRGDGFVDINDCTACLTEAGILGKEIPVQEPSIFQKIKNFGKAAAQHIIKGMPTASPEQQEARLVICRKCEYDLEGTCGVCGCNLKLKTQWAEQSCPLNPPKWGPVKPEESEVREPEVH
jgi:hypothetical protein